MKSRWISRRIDYDGEALKSLWAYRKANLQGDSMVAFRGACHVDVAALVDLEDAKAAAEIHSDDMLHVIIEHFDLDLPNMILRQRLLMAQACDLLRQRKKAGGLRRFGDDLYLGKAKLSVSIATLTPVSAKIHAGLNISSKNTPVKTVGLADLGVDAKKFAELWMNAYLDEHRSIKMARTKVRATE